MPARTNLDEIDFAILRRLQREARVSNKELAAHVGLSPSSCLTRVRQLQSQGIMRGAYAELDPRAVGVGLQAMIAVRLAAHTREIADSFRSHALGLPEVVAVYDVTGPQDFLVHVAVRDAEHLGALGMEGFAAHPAVARIETSLVLRRTRSDLPLYE
jgi:DNA-binding Lrp family transcriptional regulator